METNIKEDVNLQKIESIDDTLGTLKLSPFYVTLSNEEVKDLEDRLMHPAPIEFISNQRH